MQKKRKGPLLPMTKEILATLPEVAFVDNSWDKSPGAEPVRAVKRGEMGYWAIFTKLSADELNAAAGVTQAQALAMHTGSMVGWDAAGANPANWLPNESDRAEEDVAAQSEGTG
jgi:hypothetical protein